MKLISMRFFLFLIFKNLFQNSFLKILSFIFDAKLVCVITNIMNISCRILFENHDCIFFQMKQ